MGAVIALRCKRLHSQGGIVTLLLNFQCGFATLLLSFQGWVATLLLSFQCGFATSLLSFQGWGCYVHLMFSRVGLLPSCYVFGLGCYVALHCCYFFKRGHPRSAVFSIVLSPMHGQFLLGIFNWHICNNYVTTVQPLTISAWHLCNG